MLYAFPPKSREITAFTFKDGALYLTSEAAQHRIIPIAADIVRITYTSRDSFSEEQKPAVILRDICEGWCVRETDVSIDFFSDKLTVSINKKTASYRYLDANGKLLLAEKRAEARELDEFTAYRVGDAVTETVKTADGEKTVVLEGKKTEIGKLFHTRMNLEFADGEALYGLGQHEEGFMNLRGKAVYCYQANRKIAIPMLVSSKGWGMLVDTYSPLIFNDNEYGSRIYTEADPELDFYFINGGSLNGAVKGYRRLTGKASLLPKWAFGYMQSQERYNSFDEIIDTVKEFRRRDIGIDCIIQDWCSWPDGMWGQKEFDPVHYPNPKENIAKIHDLNAKFMLSIWPNPSRGTSDFDEFDKLGLMLETKDFYNAFDPKARELYWKQVSEKIFKHGTDAWWCDNSEPFSPEWNYIFRREEGRAYSDFVEQAGTRFAPDKLNAYPFWHAVSLYDGQRGECSEKRVVNLTRCAYTGQQRLSCILWSGDTSASWDTYRKQIAAGLNFSASGLPYWTMDIGAFFVKRSFNWYWKGDYNDTVNDPAYRELYTRWYQCGAFLPVFRGHGTDCRREPWAFESAEDKRFYDALVKVNRLRYTLIPYIYSAAADAYFNDSSIIKPLAFEFSDERVQDIKNQYMFGDSIMVCPVTRPMYYGLDGEIAQVDTQVEVYLPAGCGWYDFNTNRYYDGGQSVTVNAPLDEIPLFVRAGSIIPMTDYKPYTTAHDEVKFKVYAGADAVYHLYEDAGDGYGYERGEYKFTEVRWSQNDKTLTASDGITPNHEVIEK